MEDKEIAASGCRIEISANDYEVQTVFEYDLNGGSLWSTKCSRETHSNIYYSLIYSTSLAQRIVAS